jgi:hypothetical protein
MIIDGVDRSYMYYAPGPVFGFDLHLDERDWF